MAEDVNRAWRDQYMLRLPDGMRDRIKAAAEANSRSMNAEIVATLEERYPAPTDELTAEVVHGWARRITSSSTEEGMHLLKEINDRMAAHPEWKGWKYEVAFLPAEGGKTRRVIGLFGPDSPPDLPVPILEAERPPVAQRQGGPGVRLRKAGS
jgi:hypothetical protein